MKGKRLKIIKQRGNELLTLLNIGLIIIHKYHWKYILPYGTSNHTECIFLMLISNWIFCLTWKLVFLLNQEDSKKSNHISKKNYICFRKICSRKILILEILIVSV